MLRTRKSRQQTAMPSQEPSHITPYMPGYQADMSGMAALQAPHKHGYGGPPPVYVVSTYDARPINAVDFSVYSGTNAGGAANPDTGVDPSIAPYFTSSLFYRVQSGRVANVRDWQITIAPFSGEFLALEADNPVFFPGLVGSPASNFRLAISFLVDGVFQEGYSGLVNWQAAFGDLVGECYILAQPNQLIEMRITGNNPAGTSWNQALMTMHGNLLRSQGRQVEFEPGTDATLPVHEMGDPGAM